MDMHTVLQRIEVRRVELGETEAAISRRATGSPDTIRNWRRRLESGNSKFGASSVTLEKVAAALGRSVQWLTGEGPASEGDIKALRGGRERAMRLYDSLPPDLQAVAEKQLAALVPTAPPPSGPDHPSKDEPGLAQSDLDR